MNRGHLMYEPVPIDQLQPGIPGYLWLLLLGLLVVAVWGLYTALERRSRHTDAVAVRLIAVTSEFDTALSAARNAFRVVPADPPEIGFDTPVADILDTDPGGHRW